jgi:hypothetical protein
MYAVLQMTNLEITCDLLLLTGSTYISRKTGSIYIVFLPFVHVNLITSPAL